MVHCFLSHPDQHRIGQKLPWATVVAFSSSLLFLASKIADWLASDPKWLYVFSQGCKDRQPIGGITVWGSLDWSLVSTATKSVYPLIEQEKQTSHSPIPALALPLNRSAHFVFCHCSRSPWREAGRYRRSVWIDSHLFGYIYRLHFVSSKHVMFQRQNDISVHLLRDD